MAARYNPKEPRALVQARESGPDGGAGRWAPGGEGQDRWDLRQEMGGAALPLFLQRDKRRAKDRGLGRCQH